MFNHSHRRILEAMVEESWFDNAYQLVMIIDTKRRAVAIYRRLLTNHWTWRWKHFSLSTQVSSTVRQRNPQLTAVFSTYLTSVYTLLLSRLSPLRLRSWVNLFDILGYIGDSAQIIFGSCKCSEIEILYIKIFYPSPFHSTKISCPYTIYIPIVL